MRARLRLSLLATLTGWLAGTLLTLPLQLPFLWRNAAPGSRALELVQGCVLWGLFTLIVCLAAWCVAVMPLALAVPAAVVVRHRWLVAVGGAAGAVLLVGWKTGTWFSLRGHGPTNPLLMPLFLEYAGYALVLAGVTTLMYARLLRARMSG